MNKWDSRHVQDLWFQDEGKVRDTVGLPRNASSHSSASSSRKDAVLGKRDRGSSSKGSNPQAADSLLCRICYTGYKDTSEMVTLPCNHFFCTSCMNDFMEFEVQTGAGCSALQCPSPKCNCKLPESLVRSIAPPACYEKFCSFMLRSFVEINRSCRWCPNAGCDVAVEYPGGGVIDVNCSCGHSFCFACGDEAHRPVSCPDLKRWKVKNSAESENVTWIMANTKPCPKCQVAIEKNQGCNQ
jgi:ariadne-1